MQYETRIETKYIMYAEIVNYNKIMYKNCY